MAGRLLRRVLFVVAAAAATACAYSEQPLLEQFFNASRLRDTMALQPIATVVFEPAQDGIVRTFRIIRVTPEPPEGEVVAKNVTVNADVILPDGRSVQKALAVEMRRSSGTEGRWMVTAVRDAQARTPASAPQP